MDNTHSKPEPTVTRTAPAGGFVIDEATAAAEYETFINAFEFDVDTSYMDAEDRTQYEKNRRAILRAIRVGALTWTPENEPVLKLRYSKWAGPITFHVSEGAALMGMDKRKKNEDVAKTYAVYAGITRTTAETFAKMDLRDLKIVQAIMALFLD